jgi:DNA-directed RNA polymerase specialized sigma24 family protein
MAKPREATLNDLVMQMKITNRLLAAPLKISMGQKDLVRLLLSTGASAAEIADVLDTTAGTVASTIQRMRKTGKGPDVQSTLAGDEGPKASGS